MDNITAAIEEIARNAARETIAQLESRIRFLEKRLAEAERLPEVLNPKEAARALGVSDKTLWNYKQAGLIEFISHPGSRVGYKREHIERFLQRHERGGKKAALAA